MLLLHVTDLHFDTKVCEQIKKGFIGDALCISGDLFDDSPNCSMTIEQQISWYNAFLKELPKPVFICSGNHDVEEASAENEGWDDLSFLDADDFDDTTLDMPPIPTRNWVRELAGDGIFIDGSITEFMGHKIGCVEYNCEDLSRFYQCDILLHHVPPRKTPTAQQKGDDWGCDNLRAAIVYGEIHPKLLLCGHVHQPKKNEYTIRNTKVINPGPPNIETLLQKCLISI
ncbi:metallophosphoesterase [Shewanella sp. 10N.286.51.B2]|uniref:metallophosphoesterase family protein n=1 Tax=Shewanella sp. 10N.286.51.B2 TaxID=3229707 RepID=UPI00354AE88D